MNKNSCHNYETGDSPKISFSIGGKAEFPVDKMSSRIVELAMQILANTVEVDSYLTLNGLPQPSFEVDGPLDLGIKSREVEANRIAAIEASVELQELLLGPKMLIRPVVYFFFS